MKIFIILSLILLIGCVTIPNEQSIEQIEIVEQYRRPTVGSLYDRLSGIDPDINFNRSLYASNFGTTDDRFIIGSVNWFDESNFNNLTTVTPIIFRGIDYEYSEGFNTIRAYNNQIIIIIAEHNINNRIVDNVIYYRIVDREENTIISGSYSIDNIITRESLSFHEYIWDLYEDVELPFIFQIMYDGIHINTFVIGERN